MDTLYTYLTNVPAVFLEGFLYILLSQAYGTTHAQLTASLSE